MVCSCQDDRPGEWATLYAEIPPELKAWLEARPRRTCQYDGGTDNLAPLRSRSEASAGRRRDAPQGPRRRGRPGGRRTGPGRGRGQAVASAGQGQGEVIRRPAEQPVGKVGRPTLRCEVRPGTLQDAMIFALGDNANHGLRRSHGDKKKAILAAVAMSKAEGWKWSHREIARRCSVGHSYVSQLLQKKSVSTVDTDSSGAESPELPDPPPAPSEPAIVAVAVPDDPPAEATGCGDAWEPEPATAPEPPAQEVAGGPVSRFSHVAFMSEPT